MAQADFGKWVKELCLFFERKQPTPQTLEQWWEELKDIDPAYYQQITAYLHDLPAWPKNLPYQIRQIITQIRPQAQEQDHPAHYSPWKYARPDCPKCAGEGFTQEKATVWNKNYTDSINLSARVICPVCVEPKMTPF